jgi:hypothetical protein
MMSSQDCSDKAAICDAEAQTYKGTTAAADWQELATQWRLLAVDSNSSGTLARLMRHAKSSIRL